MCEKEEAYICVVVRHVAQAWVAEEVGSSLSIVKDETRFHIW